MCIGPEIAAAAMIVSAAVSGAGFIVQGKAAKQAADYNSALALNQAAAARQKATFDRQQYETQARKILGAQYASFLGPGGVRREGTPLELAADTAANIELDAQTIIYAGELEARGLESQSVLNRIEGRAAQRAAKFQAAGTTLLTAGQAGVSYSRATGTGFSLNSSAPT